MKISTLPSNNVKSNAGQTGRLVPFYKRSIKTPVQKHKTVFMQTLFATVKQLFAVILNRETLPNEMNVGLVTVHSCCTATPENISRTSQNHDVAQPAASFALIPTAMNQLKKK